MRVLVTGVYGFIGSYFAKWLLASDADVQIAGFGRDSDQAGMKRLGKLNSRLKLVHGDLREVSGLCEHVDVVINFAAKTFVDHSILDDEPFYQSNVVGSRNLMRDAMRYKVKRFVQVSTDEVYGQILTGAYSEDALLQPRNPYAWSKAAADLYAQTLHRMHGFPVIITRTENNFGPYQHRQKALPTFVRETLAGKPIPVYGDGQHVRCWLHVEEHCRAVWHLVQKPGAVGEVFHVAGEDELTNTQLAELVIETLGRGSIEYIPDHDVRPGHDRRYALDCSKLRATGFEVKQDLVTRLKETILWYAEHPEWTR